MIDFLDSFILWYSAFFGISVEAGTLLFLVVFFLLLLLLEIFLYWYMETYG